MLGPEYQRNYEKPAAVLFSDEEASNGYKYRLNNSLTLEMIILKTVGFSESEQIECILNKITLLCFSSKTRYQRNSPHNARTTRTRLPHNTLAQDLRGIF